MNKSHSRLKRAGLDDEDILYLSRKENERTLSLLMRILESFIGSDLSLDEINWNLKRAHRDGQSFVARTMRDIFNHEEE